MRNVSKARLASVRFNDGGSGAFVSKNGLVLTNHHVALGQLQKMSTPKKDYVKEGFFAKDLKGEIACPDLEVNVLKGKKLTNVRASGTDDAIKLAQKALHEDSELGVASAHLARLLMAETSMSRRMSAKAALFCLAWAS